MHGLRFGLAGSARTLLGGLLLTTGLAKVPVLGEFGVSLGAMFGFGLEVALLFAAGVIGGEILIGGMLVLGVRTRTAGVCALILGAAFTGLQCARIFHGAAKPCYCLGVLGNFPSGIELGVDLLLVVLAVIVLRGRDSAGEFRGLRWRDAWLLIVPAIVFAPLFRAVPVKANGDQVIFQRLRAGMPAASRDGRGIVFCLDLDNFRCALCFDDLTSLLDTLRAVDFPASGKAAAAVLRLPEGDMDSSAWRLQRWARETGFTGPLAVVPAEEFDGATGGKSVVWLAEGLDRVVKAWEFPLGPVLRDEVVSSLAGR